MSSFVCQIEDLRLALAEIRALHVTAPEILERAEKRLQQAVEHAFDVPVKCTVPASDHRRDHKPGRAANLDTGPDLQAFVRARLLRMTFEAIATDVTETFPPDRRAGKSALHAWWAKNKARFTWPSGVLATPNDRG